LNPTPIVRVASLKDVDRFKGHLRSLNVEIPCDREIARGDESILLRPITCGRFNIRNRIAVQPMEGWDGTPDGKPSEHTIRRWRRFGRSGAGLIWGGEAVAVCHAGRANPNQLVMADHTLQGLEQLRKVLVEEYRSLTGSNGDPVIGLQLTHSGRYSKPNAQRRNEPQILYRHPILDKRLGLAADHAVLSDGEIARIIEDFHRAAASAAKLGFDFVDVKHCHGYLGHEFLSAHTRPGPYGGSFENRTRFLREVVQGVRALAPEMDIGVRLSAFDSVAFRPDPQRSVVGHPGPGIPEEHSELLPYRWGFGVNAQDPKEMDLAETFRFVSLLEELGIRLVNLTAGSPYYNPHIQRPALYPPSDGYRPPEDPLVGVARQMEAARKIKERFPNLVFVGTGFSYLQEFLPLVAQGAVRERWTDLVGLGRMVLSYPEILWDALQGKTLERKLICRTFSDCTTAPRNGLPSGCYPLDEYYKDSTMAENLNIAKGILPQKPQII
jgi:2,4-dienoyl-CoA reductase-like NADH-dependent reductase (Old Yellow Enzyme family)